MSKFRSTIINKLVKKGDLQGLIKSLNNADDRIVRMEAARAIGMQGDGECVDALIEALEDEYALVRKHAAEALGMIGDPQALEPLTRALHDENNSVATYAATALGELGNEQAAEPLKALLEHDDSILRKAAEKALGKILDPYAAKAAVRSIEGERLPVEERIKVGLEVLEKLCKDRPIDPKVHIQSAVETLEFAGEDGSRAFAEFMLEVLTSRSAALLQILDAAEQLEPTQELIDAVMEIKEAKEVIPAPLSSRFTAEIVGDGKVGWTTGTAGKIRSRSLKVIASLTGAGVQTEEEEHPYSDLSGNDFSDADLDSANFQGANLAGCNFENAILRHANLSEANLKDANLKNANLYFANLTGANLRGAVLREANIYMANLTDADLLGADVSETYAPTVTLPNGLRGGLPQLEEISRGKQE